ncbi:MAG: DUF898 domain-containing protein [Alphaproteobacteria bacterium]|nr:MAG: DUF898 domain-containing protein [Alphaproteobacteria bacterium]
MSTVLQELDAEQPEPDGVTFDGQGRELFVVYLVNILLTIVTFGLYRFWGKTRIRQYVWSHLRYKGDAFEYTGTGLELFLGFVIVFFAVILPLIGVGIWVQLLLQQGDITLVIVIGGLLYLVFFCLFPIAIFRAYRYRLSRTLWRGIRFGLTGTGRVYAAKFIGYLLLQIITLGLASPYTTVKLYEYLVGNVWMGSGRFSLDPSWKPLMRPFLMFWGCIVFYFVLFVAAQVAGTTSINFLAFPTMIAIACFYFYYSAAVYRHVVGNIMFEGVRFSVDLKGRELFGLFFVNGLLLVFTLGIAFPWVIVRIMNFMVDKLAVHGEPDFEKISQNTEEMPTYGEGLAEAFDIGSI